MSFFPSRGRGVADGPPLATKERRGRQASPRVPTIAAGRGAEDSVEPTVRRLVADRLGVDADALGADVTLREDLAVDSLDLIELAVALETEFGITVPNRMLARVRTFGDVVGATDRLVRARVVTTVAPRSRGVIVRGRQFARFTYSSSGPDGAPSG